MLSRFLCAASLALRANGVTFGGWRCSRYTAGRAYVVEPQDAHFACLSGHYRVDRTLGALRNMHEIDWAGDFEPSSGHVIDPVAKPTGYPIATCSSSSVSTIDPGEDHA